jgi:FkbM family methyltransferase
MKIVQLGANKGDDELAKYIKKNYDKLDFALFVEPNLLHIEDLKKCYEGYENVFIENVAIKPSSYEQDTLKLYYYEDDAPLYQIASCIKSHIEKHYRYSNYTEDKIHEFEVPALTIDELFLKYNIQELDWLLLDVEGIDAELLLNTEWSKYDIKKIEYEELHLEENKKPIEKILKELGYAQSIALHRYDGAWIKSTGDNKMKVTLYAICKNEEKYIEKFLLNAKNFDDVVVVDTGSTDNTVQLLRDAGIEVYEHPQSKREFDFSVARNQALSYVKTDWAFSLDFNEDIQDLFLEGLDILENEITTFKHLRFDDNGKNVQQSNEVHVRFHRTKNYKWVNSVHEMPIFVPTEEYPSEVPIETSIKIIKKINRSVSKELFYFDICTREYQKDPTNWYYIWFIFNHYFNVGNHQKALEFGQKYLNVSKAYFDSFRILAFIRCSICMIQLQDISKGANYAFHAVSEAMNMGEPYLSQAFSYFAELSKKLNNPNITIFATGFNPDALVLPERHQAIDKLFLTNLEDLHTCWKGHRGFAEWLVSYLKPEVTVDLGVDWGFSTFCFAMPRIGHVYGIDSFEGDEYAGYMDDSVYNLVLNKQEKLHLKDNITFIKSYFDDVAKTWDKKIDILHIDGDHSYESVKNDFETWSKFVNEDGVILLHDTCVENINGNEYGVKRFFEEIDLPKCTFTHTFGLGVVSKNQKLIEMIQNNIDLSRPL